MKMKKGLFSAVSLLAVSSVMAAMSFSSASVSSDMSFTVKQTDGALLAITKGDHNATTYKNGELHIDLNKGKNDESLYGVQPNSNYKWDDLFAVTNNSDKTVEVSVYALKKDTTNAKPTNHGDEYLTITNGETSNLIKFTLVPGGTEAINLELATASGTPMNLKDFTLMVDAEVAKATNPGGPGDGKDDNGKGNNGGSNNGGGNNGGSNNGGGNNGGSNNGGGNNGGSNNGGGNNGGGNKGGGK